MPTRSDPVIDGDEYFCEAVDGVELLLDGDIEVYHFVLEVMRAFLTCHTGKPLRESDLARMRELFTRAADAAERAPFASDRGPCNVSGSAIAGTPP
jgi:hypothetical protein